MFSHLNSFTENIPILSCFLVKIGYWKQLPQYGDYFSTNGRR